jgi:hypothetical protein
MIKESKLDLEQPSELGFLSKTWKGHLMDLKHYGRGTAFSMIDGAVHMLRERGAEFRCLRNEKDEEQIFGFSVVEGPVLHFVYVKIWFRLQGMGSVLAAGTSYTTFYNPDAQIFCDKLKLKRIDLW